VRILSIDGGGIRGIVPGVVLCELERRAGRPVSELFDLVAGTSTGGILACALTVPGPDGRPLWGAEEVLGLYDEEGPQIFSRSLSKRVTSAWGLLDEKYDDEALNDALQRYLGDAHLSHGLCELLLTAYDLEGREPYFFKSWRTERDHRMWEAARATSAAPTYFEPLRLDRMSLVDGGVFATNPAMCAYAEARRRFGDAELFLVSLGTGELTRRIRHEDATGWGLAEWVRPVIDVVFDGVADTVDYQARHLLGDDYQRFQVRLDEGASDALDDASERNRERLRAKGREIVRDHSARLDRVVERLLA
jgi:uncharacterized protein